MNTQRATRRPTKSTTRRPTKSPTRRTAGRVLGVRAGRWNRSQFLCRHRPDGDRRASWFRSSFGGEFLPIFRAQSLVGLPICGLVTGREFLGLRKVEPGLCALLLAQ